MPQKSFKSCFYEIHGNFQWIQVWGGCLLRIRKQNVVWIINRDHINWVFFPVSSQKKVLFSHIFLLQALFLEKVWMGSRLSVTLPHKFIFFQITTCEWGKKGVLLQLYFLAKLPGLKAPLHSDMSKAKSSPHTDHEIRSFFDLITCLIFPKKLNKDQAC